MAISYKTRQAVILAHKQAKIKRMEEYALNPKICKGCNTPIDYELKSKNDFCSQSCFAKYSNPIRILKRDLDANESTVTSVKRYRKMQLNVKTVAI